MGQLCDQGIVRHRIALTTPLTKVRIFPCNITLVQRSHRITTFYDNDEMVVASSSARGWRVANRLRQQVPNSLQVAMHATAITEAHIK